MCGGFWTFNIYQTKANWKYIVSSSPANYADAKSDCASKARFVAYPSSAEELLELKEAAPGKMIWLGVTSVGPVHGNWVDENGNTDTYLSWLDGEPNDHGPGGEN